jgi:hypothetical protein
MSSLAEMATIFLAPKDRDAVRGDLAETGASGWSALGSVLGPSEWKLICATHNLLKLLRHRVALAHA